MSERIPLPSRRQNETRKLVWAGHSVFVTIGYDATRTHAREIFYASGCKDGSDLEALISDLCIALSVMLQHEGVTAASLAKSMSTAFDLHTGEKKPASILGLLLRELERPPAWTPWAQKATSGLSAGFRIGGTIRCLILGAKGNTFMHVPFYTIRENRAAQRRLCTAGSRLYGERGHSSDVSPFLAFGASSWTLRSGCKQHGQASQTGRGGGSYHYQDSWYTCSNPTYTGPKQRHLHRRNRHAGFAARALEARQPWLSALPTSGPLFTSSGLSIACSMRNSKTPTPFWCLIGLTKSRPGCSTTTVGTAMTIAAIYARVSSDQQRDSNTIASQVQALVTYADEHGYRVAPDMIIKDDGWSGTVLERPGLERVRDLAAEGLIEAVLVHSPDRLSRRYAYQVLLIEELERQGVKAMFLKAPSMNSPEDHLLLQFQGIIAEYERAQILERSRRGKRHRAKRGEVAVLSGAPYGYRYHKKTQDSDAYFEIVEPQASVVRDIYREYTCEHMSIGAITRKLNERAVPTASGRSRRWGRSKVWAILRNPAYMGKACFGKTHQQPRKSMPRPLRLRGGVANATTSGHERPREDWIEIPVPAIISEETFALAEERLVLNKARSPRRTKTPSVVQGLVTCGKCGYALSRNSTQTTARKIFYYRCLGSDSWRHLNGRLCDSRPVRQDMLDEIVWTEVVRLLENPDLIGAEINRRLEAARVADPSQKREADLRHRLTRIRKGLDRLVTAYQEELITIDELRDRTPELRRQEQALSRELQAAVDRVKDQDTWLRLAETLNGFLERLRSSAETLEVSDRQRIVRLLVKEVQVSENTIIIHHSIPIPNSEGGIPDPSKSNADAPEGSGYRLCSGGVVGRPREPAAQDHGRCVMIADPLEARKLQSGKETHRFIEGRGNRNNKARDTDHRAQIKRDPPLGFLDMQLELEKVAATGSAILNGIVNETDKCFGTFWVKSVVLKTADRFGGIEHWSVAHWRLHGWELRIRISNWRQIEPSCHFNARKGDPYACENSKYPIGDVADFHSGPGAGGRRGSKRLHGIRDSGQSRSMRDSAGMSGRRNRSGKKSRERITHYLRTFLPVALVVLGERAPYRLQPNAERPAWSGERRP